LNACFKFSFANFTGTFLELIKQWLDLEMLTTPAIRTNSFWQLNQDLKRIEFATFTGTVSGGKNGWIVEC
jgi:hypothetical protein